MKNYLVILVVIGIALAYWYQMPEPSKPAAETPTPQPPAPAPVVVAKPRSVYHSPLEQPATQAASGADNGKSMTIGSNGSPQPSNRH